MRTPPELNGWGHEPPLGTFASLRRLLEERLGLQSIIMDVGEGQIGIVYFGDKSEEEVREACELVVPICAIAETLKIDAQLCRGNRKPEQLEAPAPRLEDGDKEAE